MNNIVSTIDKYQYNYRQPFRRFSNQLKEYYDTDFLCYIKVFDNGKYFMISNNSNFDIEHGITIKTFHIISDYGLKLEGKDNEYISVWPNSANTKLLDFVTNYNLCTGISFYKRYENSCDLLLIMKKEYNENYKDYIISKSEYFSRLKNFFRSNFFDGITSDLPLTEFKNTPNINFNLDKVVYKNNFNDEEFMKAIYANGGKFNYNESLVELTLKEIEVLHNLGDTYSVEKVANKLGISSKTVNSHIQNIKAKFDYVNKWKLMRISRKLIL